MASGRSFIMYNYNYIGWNYYKTGDVEQGYQSGTNEKGDVLQNFYTSFTPAAYTLATIPGTFGRYRLSYTVISYLIELKPQHFKLWM